MGFSGKTSLIGCKIGALNRLPASFFVSVAYDCWAFRLLAFFALVQALYMGYSVLRTERVKLARQAPRAKAGAAAPRPRVPPASDRGSARPGAQGGSHRRVAITHQVDFVPELREERAAAEAAAGIAPAARRL